MVEATVETGVTGTSSRTARLARGHRYGLYLSAVLAALFCIRLLGEPWSTDSHSIPGAPARQAGTS